MTQTIGVIDCALIENDEPIASSGTDNGVAHRSLPRVTGVEMAAVKSPLIPVIGGTAG